MSVDMQTFLDSAVNDAVGVRVRCGEQKNPRTIGIVLVGSSGLDPSRFANFDPTEVDSWEEAYDSINAMLEGVGWGTEPGEECARLHLLGEKGNQLRTWSRTQWPDTAEQADTTAMLAGELIRMASEMRRSFGVVCDALSDQAVSRENAVTEMIESHRREVEAHAEAALASTLAEIEAEVDHPGDPLRDTAAQVMQGLASQFLPGAGPGAIDAKSLILETLRNDPAMVEELVADPAVVEMFMRSQATAEEILPNPMDE